MIRIIRIALSVPVFAVVSLVTLAAQSTSVYLAPLMNLYEATALVAFFALLSEFVSPDEEERQVKMERYCCTGTYNVRYFIMLAQRRLNSWSLT